MSYLSQLKKKLETKWNSGAVLLERQQQGSFHRLLDSIAYQSLCHVILSIDFMRYKLMTYDSC